MKGGAMRRYTYRPDLPDQRDRIYKRARHFFGLLAVRPPPAADLHAQLPPAAAPYDQKSIGSCTGNGNARALAFAHWKATGEWLNPSRLMIYYLERFIEGTIGQDAGAQIRDGMKAMAKWGACLETLWPYIVSKFKAKPSAAAYADAATRKITSYHRVLTLDDVKACIGIDGFPVVFGFTVYESFEGEETARTGIIAMPQPHEKVLGGHCMVIDQYDDATGMLSGPNSWSPRWGDAGRFHMPYAFFQKRGLVSDKWTVRA
jgi:C1A family cysteine protease